MEEDRGKVQIRVTVRVIENAEVIEAAEYTLDQADESVAVVMRNGEDSKLYEHYMQHQGKVLGRSIVAKSVHRPGGVLEMARQHGMPAHAFAAMPRHAAFEENIVFSAQLCGHVNGGRVCILQEAEH